MFVDNAAPGNVMDNVIIERQSESTMSYGPSAREAYLGYVTLKVEHALDCLHVSLTLTFISLMLKNRFVLL